MVSDHYIATQDHSKSIGYREYVIKVTNIVIIPKRTDFLSKLQVQKYFMNFTSYTGETN